MIIKMTKYCIMTEDLKQVEVGTARNYSFIPIKDLEHSKSKINLFNSYKVAKSSFERSWWNIKWDEESQRFLDQRNWNKTNFVIKKLTITYDIDINKEDFE